MRMRFIALSVLVLVTAGSLRADVAPFPSWRLAANDAITSAVQGGDVVYVGGRFSRVGEGLTPFVGVIDPAALTFAPRTGCATEAGHPADRRYLRPRSVQSLADGVGRPIKSVYKSLERIRQSLLECIQRTVSAEDRQ